MKIFKQKQKKKLNKREIGNQYETLAKHYLLRQGLTFIESNYTTQLGEIDLIMQDAETIIFVEVKYRTNQRFGHAAEMVTPTKCRKLLKTAMLWLKQRSYNVNNTSIRFDIIAIHQQGSDIEWIKNAITQG